MSKYETISWTNKSTFKSYPWPFIFVNLKFARKPEEISMHLKRFRGPGMLTWFPKHYTVFVPQMGMNTITFLSLLSSLPSIWFALQNKI